MKRFVARLIISFFADAERPLPNWVQRLVETDSQVGAYYNELHLLQDRLRSDAKRYPLPTESQLENASVANDTALVSPEMRRSHVQEEALVRSWKFITLAVAASLLVVVTWAAVTRWAVPQPPREVAKVDQAVDVKPFLASLSACNRVIQQLSMSGRNLVSELSTMPEVIEVRQQMINVDGVKRQFAATALSLNASVAKWSNAIVDSPGDSTTKQSVAPEVPKD